MGERAGGVARPLLVAVVGIAFGAFVLPALIFGCGVSLLGRYEAASMARVYEAVFDGLGRGSVASWIVSLGPYLLWQLFRLLRRWWLAAAVVSST